MQWRERLFLVSCYPLDEIRRKAYQTLLFLFVSIVIGGGFAFHAAKADEPGSHSPKGSGYLSDTFREQLYNHPSLRQSVARSCRAIFVLGQRRAEAKLDLSASISGERQIASNFKTSSSDALPSSIRAYNDAYDDVYDLEVAARYRLYDWGVSDARIRSEEHRLQAERLGHENNLNTIVEDILRVTMQINSARDEVAYRKQALTDIAPHVIAIEAQGQAGSIGLAEVRATKLSVLNAEVALQRAERRLAENLKGLELSFKISIQDATPLLDTFLANRRTEFFEIDATDWIAVRELDARIAGQQADLIAIENERYPRVDSVFETTVFDVTDYESEYQLVGRLEFSLPLYDGGSNKARQQEKSWQVKELRSQREEQLRSHKTNTQQGRLIISRRLVEMATIREQLEDIEARYQSLNSLVGNSLVSRQQIIQLLGERTQKYIELSQLEWQQEFGYVRLNTLANNLGPLLGIQLGGNQC